MIKYLKSDWLFAKLGVLGIMATLDLNKANQVLAFATGVMTAALVGAKLWVKVKKILGKKSTKDSQTYLPLDE